MEILIRFGLGPQFIWCMVGLHDYQTRVGLYDYSRSRNFPLRSDRYGGHASSAADCLSLQV